MKKGFSFKSLFIKEQDEQVVTESSNDSQNAVHSSTHPIVTPIGGVQSISSGPGTVDPKFIEIIGNKLDSLNIEGEDYLELKEALDSLLKIAGMNENTAFISAFATLQTKGLTLDKVLTSIDYYMEELGKEKELFKQAQSIKYDETVASIDTEISSLNTQSEEDNSEILRLQEKIQVTNSTVSEKTTEMNNNKVSLEQEQSNFDATLSHFITVMNTDKEKVNKYLNTPEQA